jgi:quinol monooxygenase YgiN
MYAPAAAQAPADATVFTVAYVEISPSSRATALAALKQYRETSRKDDGSVGLDVFEQNGRPGHFAVVETWKNQNAYDAHEATGHRRRLMTSIDPLRLSDYDQRPYKALSVGSAPAATNPQAIHVVTHVDAAPAPPAATGIDGPGWLKQLAEASRREKGNLQFDVVQHTIRGNHFTVIETWQSQAALDAHAAAMHTRQYRDGLAPLLGSPLDERTYKAVP